MAESEETIPENSENPEPQEAPPAPSAPSAPSEPAAEPKRGRGRPAGSKDKAPRVKVRVEPIPQPEPKPAPAQSGVASDAPPAAAGALPDRALPVVERPPSPEPPSPRTLFRQTSAHLLNLRDVMNSQKRASTAEKYTSRLHAWPVE